MRDAGRIGFCGDGDTAGGVECVGELVEAAVGEALLPDATVAAVGVGGGDNSAGVGDRCQLPGGGVPVGGFAAHGVGDGDELPSVVVAVVHGAAGAVVDGDDVFVVLVVGV